MKRKLTNEEEKLEKLGLERNKKELDLLNYNYSFNKACLDKQRYLREWDDKWREPERLRKDLEDNNILNTIQAEIDMKKNAIKIAEDHIREGVTIKDNKSVG